MIVVRPNGGLGNQLFQYAAGRHLAHLRDDDLRFELSLLNLPGRRKYELDHFRLIGEPISNQVRSRMLHTDMNPWKRVLFQAIERTKPYYRRTIFKEKRQFSYDHNIVNTPADVILSGYWQTEKYFVKIRTILLNEITLRNRPKSKTLEVSKRITENESVAIHIRRGDYVQYPQTYQYHGTCSLEYYQACIRLISDKISFPHFFIFSDDPDWAFDNIIIPFPTEFVRHNGPEAAHEDLWLMSRCKHQIIANSSFSWWGAWLNQNPDKIVLAPEKWLNINDSRHGTDLLPISWIKL